MRQSHILADSQKLAEEFARCCTTYDSVSLAVAWCGNPAQTLPYKHLEAFGGKITATIGVAFNHTHPDAIEWFQDLGADVRIFRDTGDLFHPKVYLFRQKTDYALFVGSSNLTYGGFYSNIEVNTLIEGSLSVGKGADVRRLQEVLLDWHSPAKSFKPQATWLAKYRADYLTTTRTARQHGIRLPPRVEEDIGMASWLRNADWSLYYGKVREGLRQHDRNGQGYHDVLDAAAAVVPLPWKSAYFKDIEKRRVIGGIKKYGWLGHVAASGQFRHLMANGGQQSWDTIARCINEAAELTPPIPWKRLERILAELVALGSTMKVWGRLLCLVRPDLYCTVASVSVRTNLSATLGVRQSLFEDSDGYVQLIRLIHSSPWFNSRKPSNQSEAKVWDRRVAFMDAIFY